MTRLIDAWSTSITQRAAVALVLVGIVGGIVGVVVIARGLSFTAEAFAHTVFPGSVLAAAAGGSVLLGGLAAGLVAAVAVALASRSPRTSDEAAIAVVFTGLFALGAVLVAVLGPLDRNVTAFLFGAVLAVDGGDLLLLAVAGAGVLVALFAIRRPLVASSFHREAAAAAGVGVTTIDAVVLTALTVTVVVAVQAVGNMLVVAMLITPAATARVLTRGLARNIVVAAIAGALAGLVGLSISAATGLAAGACVVLTATAILVIALLAATATRRRGTTSGRRQAQPIAPTAI